MKQTTITLGVFTAAAEQLWARVRELCRTGAAGAVAGDDPYEARALASLREQLQNMCVPWLREAEMRVRAIHGCPLYAGRLALHVDQIKTFQASAAHVWSLARAWVEQDLDDALALIETESGDSPFLACLVFGYVQRAGRKVVRPGLIPLPLLDQRIAALGGARHFAAYALAMVLDVRVRILFDVALARHRDEPDLQCDLPLLAHPGLRARLGAVDGLWADDIAPQIRVLCAMTQDEFENAARVLLRQDRQLAGVHREAYGQVAQRDGELRDARREGATLRTRLEQARRSIEQQARQLDELRARPPVVRPAQAPAPAGANDETMQQLRLARRELEMARAQLLEQEADLLQLREFCELLLSPPPAPADSGGVAEPRDLGSARVIVVGGHERFHQKLRRVLPSGVFLHPDLAVCPPDVFPEADCVVYCMDYCSHTLARAAMDLARRHRLKAGYANHSNVDMVAQKVREILAG